MFVLVLLLAGVASGSPSKLWSLSLFQYGINGPVFSNHQDVVFLTGESGSFLAVDPQSGRVVLNQTLSGSIQGTPTVRADGSILVGAGKLLYALANGTTLWTYNATEAVFTDPVLDSKGNIYFGTRFGVGLIVSLTGDGELRWRYKVGKSVQSTPAISGRSLIFCSNDNSTNALDLNGTLLWKVTNSLGGDQFSHPLVWNDLVLVGSNFNGLFALDFASGDIVWHYQADVNTSFYTPIVWNGVVYVGSSLPNRKGGSVHAIDPTSGKPEWTVDVGSPVFGLPMVLADAHVLFGADDSIIRAFSPNGTIAWTFALVPNDPIFARPAFRDVLVASNIDTFFGIKV